MADTPRRRSNLLQFALIFALVYIGSQFVLKTFFPDQFGGQPTFTGVRVTATSTSTGNESIVTVENRSGTGLILPSRCPKPPFDVFSVENSGQQNERMVPAVASGAVINCPAVPSVIPEGGKADISLAPWKYALFSRMGTYELRLPEGTVRPSPSGTGSGAVTPSAPAVARFTVGEPNAFIKLFRTFILAPFLNVLIFIASLLPGHNLGVAIIILTILVKLVLYIPTQHAMEGQKKMQMLQPKLAELKHRYPNDPKKVQEETMKLWSEHKINPFQSCLPTLIQFPILIGLFYAIRDGAAFDSAQHLVYPIYQNLPWSFGTNFLGLDLLQSNAFLMAPLLVILQFLQMKLAFTIQARKTKKGTIEQVVDVPPKGEKLKQPKSSQDMQQQVMLYGLPLMIGFFAFQFPAAVSLYWGISTLFGIGQQLLVNREHLTVRP